MKYLMFAIVAAIGCWMSWWLLGKPPVEQGAFGVWVGMSMTYVCCQKGWFG